jgi:phage shock protein A
MDESIFVRVQRVVSAGLDSAVSNVERANSTGLMREAMREADRAIDRLVVERETALARSRNADARLKTCRQEHASLDEQARFALTQQRADLAQAAIERQVELEEQIAALEAGRTQALADDQRLERAIEELTRRRQQMKEELVAFRNGQSAAAAVADVAMPIEERMAKKVAEAESLFDRVLEEAGGVSGRGTAPADAPLAEIAALQKKVAVAERLAALAGANPATAKPATPPRKSAGAKRAG